jgi:hypothetical protein
VDHSAEQRRLHSDRPGGADSDIPVAGDFDGDGKTDLAVYRRATGYWYILNSSGLPLNARGPNGYVEVHFGGAPNDIPVPGDFDGDGKTDLALYRGGQWIILPSSGGYIQTGLGGADSDIPVAGDFDGDGKTDLAVYRKATGYWYILNSSGLPLNARGPNGYVEVHFGGAPNDIPVPPLASSASVSTITQTASTCSYSINRAGIVSPSTGGQFSFSISTAAGCAWSAVAGVPWITLATGSSGSGGGLVSLDVAPNSGGPRSGTVSIAGQTFTVSQTGWACGAVDITAQMGVVMESAPTYIYPSSYEYSGKISVINNSGASMPGPVYLVLLGLPNWQNFPYGNGLLGSQELTTCFSSHGDYLIPVAGRMQAGQRVDIPLLFFTQSLGGNPNFSPKVLEGMPSK